MVALRGKEIDSFLARPDPARPIILLYGPDAGLVRERADALLKSAVDDPNDPFSMVKLDGDELSAEPSRLVDEALTVPLFGGRRVIRVRAGTRNFAGGIDTLAEMGVKDCRIVIEAGELRAENPLRKACERAKTAVAIGCYPDGERDLAKLIDDELKIASLRIAPDARAALMSLLGGDRQASRNELTVFGIPCLGLNGGPVFKQSEAFSFQIATDNQEETDRYWNAIVSNGGEESACGWCKDRWGLSWQITPRTLTEAMAAGGAEAKRAFSAMMTMRKIDVAAIDAARRG